MAASMHNTQKDIEEDLRSLWVHSELTDNLCYWQLLSEIAYLLRAYLQHLLPNHLNEVEDLLQACLLAVHLKQHTYEEGDWLTDWLYDICVYKWSLHQQRQGRGHSPAPKFEHWHMIAPNQQPHSAYASRHDTALVIKQLSPEQKMAVNLARLGDTSVFSTQAAQQKHGAHLHKAIQAFYLQWCD
jgi:RNA polymerase sigma-70 factor (ECF subfamily)